MTADKPRAPANLGTAGRRFWKRATDHFAFQPYHLDILEQACRALDRAESCREQIAHDGAMIDDRFDQKKAHPLIAAERDARSAFRLLYRELGINDDETNHEVGRPPQGYVT